LVKILAFYSEQALISLVLDSKLDVAICAIPAFGELALDSPAPVNLCFVKWRKIHPATVPVEAKACSNYLNGMLARKDAKKRGFDIGILLTTEGYVAEGSTESVFLVKDGVLKTPRRGNILSSITRMSVLEAAPAIGIKTVEADITREELMAADEIFVAHTGIKIHLVKRLEDRVFEQVPGPVTQRLHQLMDDICHFRDARFKDWFQPVGGKAQHSHA
jgi:branched-chain amino acid aminotransferase